MLVKTADIIHREGAIYKALIRKVYDPKTDECKPKLDAQGQPVIVPGVEDVQPAQEYNQNCFIKKKSRSCYIFINQ